jgi:hypothetical protein
LAKRPAFASGKINLPISVESRKLTVSAEPRDKTIEPGGATKIAVEVKDFAANRLQSAKSRLSSLTKAFWLCPVIQSPIRSAFFTPHAREGVTDYHSRKDVLLGNPEDCEKSASAACAKAMAEMSVTDGECKEYITCSRKRVKKRTQTGIQKMGR